MLQLSCRDHHRDHRSVRGTLRAPRRVSHQDRWDARQNHHRVHRRAGRRSRHRRRRDGLRAHQDEFRDRRDRRAACQERPGRRAACQERLGRPDARGEGASCPGWGVGRRERRVLRGPCQCCHRTDYCQVADRPDAQEQGRCRLHRLRVLQRGRRGSQRGRPAQRGLVGRRLARPGQQVPRAELALQLRRLQSRPGRRARRRPSWRPSFARASPVQAAWPREACVQLVPRLWRRRT